MISLDHKPQQIRLIASELEDIIALGNMKKQLKLWKSYMLVGNQKANPFINNPFRDSQHIKVYMDRYTFTLYNPCSSLVDNMHAITLHFKKVNAWPRGYSFGDIG